MYYEPEYLLRRFTDHFKQNYKVECISALHHNKRKTNYHIHLIFAERQLLDKPIEKIATRNMFYDEKGKHRRTTVSYTHLDVYKRQEERKHRNTKHLPVSVDRTWKFDGGNCLLKKYYEDAKYNAAFVRCVDVMSQMLQKYGHQVLDKLEQDAPQKVEHSKESNQAQPLTNKAA